VKDPVSIAVALEHLQDFEDSAERGSDRDERG
jgi:hypothetical protein